jgi:nitrate/nitrite transporter NarK
VSLRRYISFILETPEQVEKGDKMAEIQGRPAVYRWWALVLAALINFLVGGIAWTIMPGLFNEISQEPPVGLGLSLLQLGTIWGIFPLAVAIFSIPMGMAADRYGVRLIIGSGLLLTAIAGALRGTSTGFATLLIWMFLFGIGFSAIGSNLPKFIGTWFPPRELGMSNGIAFSLYSLGAGLAMQFGGSVISPAVGGWRNILFITGGAIIIIVILWLFIARERKAVALEIQATQPQSRGFFYGIKVALRTRDIWFLSIVQFAMMAGYIGLIGFLPVYLVDKGISISTANGMVSLALYALIAGNIIIPILSDRLGSRKWFYIAFVGTSAIAAFFTAFATGGHLALALIIWGFTGGASTLIFVVPLEHPSIGPILAGSTIGLVIALGNIGGFASPMIGNAIAEGTGGIAAITFWVACYACSALAFILITETHPRRAKK